MLTFNIHKLMHLPYQDYILMFVLPPLIILFIVVNMKEKDLNRVKDRKVGDGQYGSARWIKDKEVKELFKKVPYEPEKWRMGKNRENLKQGLLLGINKKNIATLDMSDSNSMLVGPSGIGKTNFFLMPQIEYAAASGMSFLVTDTKGYIFQKMSNILKKYYGYNVVLIDFRNPIRSDKYNLMQLVNKYMDIYRAQPETQMGLISEAKAQKYAKIISVSIIESAGFKGGGDNSYFYDSAEGIITSSILLIAEYGNKNERHIISVFKLIQELSKNISSPEDANKDLQTEFAKLIMLLPENHKAKWFAGAAVEADIKTALSVFATALSKLTKFIDSELEQIICFDGDFTAEDFAKEKTAVFVVLPEEDKTKYFLFSIFLMQLYRELLNIADEKGGSLKNRVMFFEDEFGTIPPIQDVEMVFSASRSRNILSVPIIQSFGQLKKNYGEEGKDIILDNCQNIIFSGFAPTSKTPDDLSKAMGSYTTQSGSVSVGWRHSTSRKENQNMSVQMVGRPLMTADEIKRIKKGDFIVLKTGSYPMKVKIPLYKDWGIELRDDFTVQNGKINRPKYVSVNELKEKIIGESLKVENYKKEKESTKNKSIYDKLKRD
ncbi:type IV secretory system conjugative DNA transfer family protein [Clostridium felsineum]|uniref:VirD4-like conjugal transfer protein, CD1115 family n=1 Tax=Clostridium felsineum TaxID=36839 RepID=UPI00214D2984|nr:type IV secretory system conjugative DNA transfer family protein [Clostridium felsineum]MCR3758919.1 type IV secretory system conjugative DNA transfer family protein [Clostridium felsineum]